MSSCTNCCTCGCQTTENFSQVWCHSICLAGKTWPATRKGNSDRFRRFERGGHPWVIQLTCRATVMRAMCPRISWFGCTRCFASCDDFGDWAVQYLQIWQGSRRFCAATWNTIAWDEAVFWIIAISFSPRAFTEARPKWTRCDGCCCPVAYWKGRLYGTRVVWQVERSPIWIWELGRGQGVTTYTQLRQLVEAEIKANYSM